MAPDAETQSDCNRFQLKLRVLIRAAENQTYPKIGSFKRSVYLKLEEIRTKIHSAQIDDASQIQIDTKFRQIYSCVGNTARNAHLSLKAFRIFIGTVNSICDNCCVSSPEDVAGCVSNKIAEAEDRATDLARQIYEANQNLNLDDSVCKNYIEELGALVDQLIPIVEMNV